MLFLVILGLAIEYGNFVVNMMGKIGLLHALEERRCIRWQQSHMTTLNRQLGRLGSTGTIVSACQQETGWRWRDEI